MPQQGSQVSQPRALPGRLEPLSKKQRLNEGAGRRELKMHLHKKNLSPASCCWQTAHWPPIQQGI